MFQRTIDREAFFKPVGMERSVIFRIENLQGAKGDISLTFHIPASSGPQRIRVYMHNPITKYSDGSGCRVAEGDIIDAQ